MIDISEGRTNNFLVKGVLMSTVSFVLLCLSSYSYYCIAVAIPSMFFAILLFLSTNGLEINISKSEFRKYGKIGTFKFGKWNDLIEPLQVNIQLHSSNAYKPSFAYFGKAANLNSSALTFDVYVMNSSNETQKLYDFLEYVNAKKAALAIGSQYKISVEDKVSEKLLSNRMKRQQR